jgi:hypothetical protein
MILNSRLLQQRLNITHISHLNVSITYRREQLSSGITVQYGTRRPQFDLCAKGGLLRESNSYTTEMARKDNSSPLRHVLTMDIGERIEKKK